MPVYRPDHVEYNTVGGHIKIAMEDGSNLPAYWSHPNVGDVFPGVVLIHDWWGITEVERRLATLFAQTGYYVIVPDLFDGKVATTPQDAMRLVERLGEAGGDLRVNAALEVLETHHRSNHQVAAVGLGMGGSFALEAAVTRTDLEAAVAYYGFPQRCLGRFTTAKTPVLAVYGTREPHVPKAVIDQLERELNTSERASDHRVFIVEGAGRDFFTSSAHYSVEVWQTTLDFLEQHLHRPQRVSADQPL